jgi:ribose 1,5-bisphosphokinase
MNPIGPGGLVVVIGPSGAGKDTLIARARVRLDGDPTIVFPRRVVTRTASDAEDHDTVSDEVFDAGARSGAFAFWWQAHGLKYALPAAIDDHIRAGSTVVCNVSRGVVATLRCRYARVAAVLVTAPAEVLAARLAARGRASDGEIARRIARAAPADADLSPNYVIDNVGTPDEATAELVAAIAAVAEVTGPTRLAHEQAHWPKKHPL